MLLPTPEVARVRITDQGGMAIETQSASSGTGHGQNATRNPRILNNWQKARKLSRALAGGARFDTVLQRAEYVHRRQKETSNLGRGVINHSRRWLSGGIQFSVSWMSLMASLSDQIQGVIAAGLSVRSSSMS